MRIGLNLGDRHCTRTVAPPGRFFNHDRDAIALFKMVRDRARQNIRRSARGERNDDAHRLAGIGLCDCGPRGKDRNRGEVRDIDNTGITGSERPCFAESSCILSMERITCVYFGTHVHD